MKLIRLLSVVAAVVSSSAFAEVYKCGLFLNKDQTPTSTATLDVATQEQIVMQSENYLGVFQVSKKQNGEKQLVIGAVGKDKVTAATAFPLGSNAPIIQLSRSQEEYTTVLCAKGATELVAPEQVEL